MVTSVAVLALIFPACGDDDSEEEGATATTNPLSGASVSTIDPAAAHGNEGATASCSPSATSISLVAENTQFDKTCLAVPANQAFTIALNNKDGNNHGFVIAESQTSSTTFFEQTPFRGPQTMSLSVGPLRAGNFAFKCQVHPDRMQGTFIVR